MFLYNVAIYFYMLGVAIASLFSDKVRKMWHGQRQTPRILKEKVKPDVSYIWFHASSLGEFEQGRPLIERIRSEYPEYKILLTFFSPSGYEVRKNYEQADIICYLPLDTKANATHFLRTVRPAMAFFIKYDFWLNYLYILKQQGIPVYSVSSIFRPGQIFFRWYARPYSYVLKCFTHLFVQNEVSVELLRQIGIENSTIVGDTRFDRVLQIKQQAKQLPIAEAFKGDGKVIVAGSSWQPDEDVLIRYINNNPDWKLIIAPHVINEEHLQQIEQKLARSVVRYTKTTPEDAAKAGCLIVDCFGLLSSIYHYGEIAYVGGGFGVGIHNVLEAAVWSMPVIFGPNNQKFQEAQGLKRAGGGFEFETYEEFHEIITRLINDSQYLEQAGVKAGKFVSSMTGATEMIIKAIKL